MAGDALSNVLEEDIAGIDFAMHARQITLGFAALTTRGHPSAENDKGQAAQLPLGATSEAPYHNRDSKAEREQACQRHAPHHSKALFSSLESIRHDIVSNASVARPHAHELSAASKFATSCCTALPTKYRDNSTLSLFALLAPAISACLHSKRTKHSLHAAKAPSASMSSSAWNRQHRRRSAFQVTCRYQLRKMA